MSTDIEQARQEAEAADDDIQPAEKVVASTEQRSPEFLVLFRPDDQDNSLNWSTKFKWGVTGALSATGFNRIMISTVQTIPPDWDFRLGLECDQFILMNFTLTSRSWRLQ